MNDRQGEEVEAAQGIVERAEGERCGDTESN